MRQGFFSSGRWKNWFAFSRNERYGILSLISLIIICSAILFFLHYLSSQEDEKVDFTSFKKMADEFYASNNENQSASEENHFSVEEQEFASSSKLFVFDPNEATLTDFVALGLSPRVAGTILKYRERGGRFRKSEDFEKIYGIRRKDYERLKPFIAIAYPTKENSDARMFSENKCIVKKIDIGIADTLELTRIRGVGDVFARRIFKYRSSLGGFFSLQQLREVFGMSDSLFQLVLPQVELKDTVIENQINLNAADYTALSKHPYIDGKLASTIQNYRRQHGRFANVEIISTFPMVNEELFRKLVPYIKAE